jgi:predicted TIM-barrel fold metal-dependent hydrolase
MTIAVSALAGSAEQSLEDRMAGLRAIDTDVHNDLPSYAELKPFLASAWHPWLETGGPRFAARAYANTGSGRMDDAVREEDDLAAGDPDWVIQQLLRKFRIDIAVMTGTMTGASIQPDPRFSSALVSAYNDWLLAKWVRPYACFKGSINVAPQDPEAAAREIHRLGDDPGMVQVLMASAARIPYGQQYYWPIYQAAVDHNLPVAIHVGAEGTGIAKPPTGVGYPSTYLEFHTDHSQTMMAHCVSVISEGLFEQFPTLRFGFIEGGICWAPYVMWRLDRMYPSLKVEVPRLRKLPSEYILSNCYFSTQPIEEPDERQHLVQMFEMLHAEKTVIFASDYPHWDFDNPLTVLSYLPPKMRRRIFVDNVVDFFGPRVLQPHTTA